MYWDECINVVNDYTGGVYDFTGGTLKTDFFQNLNEYKKLKGVFDYLYKNFKIFDSQLFLSIAESTGMGMHTDTDNVIIYVLEGEVSYLIDGNKEVHLKQGDTFFIPKERNHSVKASKIPRICISCGTPMDVSEEQVTYHYNYI
jgi:mannose-6-phosphate isomerase-like protein (cupin superfamily)